MAHVIDIIDIMSWLKDTLNTPLYVFHISKSNNNFATGINKQKSWPEPKRKSPKDTTTSSHISL